jgi:membrane protease YdiL (CAAX protease family)
MPTRAAHGGRRHVVTIGTCRAASAFPYGADLPDEHGSTMPQPMPKTQIAALLLGFPLGSTLISLLLLQRDSLAWTGLEFFTAFWLLITAWYGAQIAILGRALRTSGWTWNDIGYRFGRRGTAWFVGGYLLFAAALLVFVEHAMAGASLDPEKLRALSDLSNLTPKTWPQRIVFVLMGLAAGLCEELVYRGFAISALRSHGMNRWLAVVLAALPFVFQHGLKSIDQFAWFFTWGLVFGVLFVALRRLTANIVIHWLVILSAVLAVLQVLQA